MPIARAAWIAPFFVALAAAGCSTSSKLAEEPDYDILEGDFLSEKEFEDLGKDDAIAYCLELSQEVDIQKDNSALTEKQIEELQSQLHESKDRLLKLQVVNRAREDSIAVRKGGGAEKGTPLAEHYTVVPGDWLSTIAAQDEIFGDWKAWRRLFEANRDRILEPNLIFPGQVLTIPRKVSDR